MMLNMLYFFPIMVIMPIISITTNYSHLLMCLLNLEVMILGLVVMLASYSVITATMDVVIILTLLTIGACSASLGLSCMVKMTRSYGNDNLQSISMTKC